jgi:autotransporter strand-loop-strand O-heptosyltransferase
LENKRVYISFGSKSLGDTLAWIPYVEEFRKKHKCDLIVSTFLNYLFVDQYPNIEFVEPGHIVKDIHAQYRLGWFYNEDGSVNYNMTPVDYKTQPLQKTATEILGLEYTEIRPKLNLPNLPKKKKVGIGLHSTAQAKYWNNPDGWQEVVNHLIDQGYECMVYSKEGDGYMGNKYPKGVTVFEGDGLQCLVNDLVTCEFFIGLSSGLSWLAWACELPVVLISGFSEKWTETTLDTYRVINESVCHGCFNWSRLDAGDWNWCPKHKGSDKQFECSKTISSEMVIKEINKIMGKPINDESYSLSDDSVTIVLSHADNEWRKNILDECLENISGEVILSTNFPVEPKTQKLCDWVLYNKNNPLLTKNEYNKFNVSYDYWYLDTNGNKVVTQLDYDHGYAAYTLIQQGIKFAKQIGKNKVHIINYDYVINNDNITQNNILLDSFDSVFYTYKEKSYSEDSYCVGFLSGNVDKLNEIFSHYKSMEEYYTDDNKYKILEVITFNLVKKYGLNTKELYFEDLNSLTNREGVLMFSKNNNFNKFKYISDKYECDKTSRHEYHKVYDEILHPISDEEFNLFEIGIDRGKSVNVWRDYLKRAKIYGLDVNQEWSHDRGRIFKGDQSNINDLQNVVNSLGSCRIIIDDGSHNPEHQIKSFYFLFKNLLESGGYYVIEDIETSYWDPLSSLYGYEIGHLNIIDHFTKLNHQLNHKYNNLVDNLGIESIKFSPNSITIKKI